MSSNYSGEENEMVLYDNFCCALFRTNTSTDVFKVFVLKAFIFFLHYMYSVCTYVSSLVRAFMFYFIFNFSFSCTKKKHLTCTIFIFFRKLGKLNVIAYRFPIFFLDNKIK